MRDIIGNYEELLRQCAQEENTRYGGSNACVEGKTNLLEADGRAS